MNNYIDYDNIENILLSLSLDDLNHFCKINKTINNVCKTSDRLKNKFNNINTLVNLSIEQIHNNDDGVILLPVKNDMTTKPFYDIIAPILNINYKRDTYWYVHKIVVDFRPFYSFYIITFFTSYNVWDLPYDSPNNVDIAIKSLSDLQKYYYISFLMI
jgi:hypothetical protein